MLLKTIKTVGNSITSTILAFFDPSKYGVLDFHVWKEIYNEEIIPKDLYSNINHLLDFFEKLREISIKTGFSCREIEIAYFMKNKERTDTNE